MKQEVTYFESTRDNNSLQTFQLVEKRMQELGIKKIILASTTGRTALAAMEYFTDKDIKLIVVPHQNGFSSEDNLFPKEVVDTLHDHGHEVHIGTMLFHTDKIFGSNVPAVVANFLRCFSEGVKVCIEITLMAADGGQVSQGEQVMVIAGTSKNADTALVMQAASSRHLEKLKVNEILCKPYNKL